MWRKVNQSFPPTSSSSPSASCPPARQHSRFLPFPIKAECLSWHLSMMNLQRHQHQHPRRIPQVRPLTGLWWGALCATTLARPPRLLIGTLSRRRSSFPTAMDCAVPSTVALYHHRHQLQRQRQRLGVQSGRTMLNPSSLEARMVLDIF